MFTGRLRIARIVGIDIFIHWTFLLLLLWFFWMDASRGGLRAGFVGVAFILSLFLCVLLHELGHSLAARRFGIATRDITLLPIGGVAALAGMPRRPSQEIIVALAGPAVNVVIAVALALALIIRGVTTGLDGLLSGQTTTLTGGDFVVRLLAVNVILLVFNLIPAFPMDGGRVLRALLAMGTSHVNATRIATRVGQALALGFAVLGLFTGNLLLVLIAVFVMLGAQAELRSARILAGLSGLRVGDVMRRQFVVVPIEASAERAADVAAAQDVVPVVDELGEIRGVIDAERLATASDRGMSAGALLAEAPRATTLNEDQSLVSALQALEGQGSAGGVVVRNGRVVGLLGRRDVARAVRSRGT